MTEHVGGDEGDGVNTTIEITVAFSAQLNRLAICGDYNVVDCIAVSSARVIVELIARNLENLDAVNCYSSIASIRGALHEIRDRNRLVSVIGWPQRDVHVFKRDRWTA